MSKIIKLNESDLVRLVKRIIKEQDDLRLSTPEQEKMMKYVRSQWKNSEYEQNSRNITMSDPKTKRLLDFNYSTRKIVFEKPMGMDPSPISIDVKFPEFKAWFDKNNNINPISPMMENKIKRKSTNEQIGRDEEGDLNFEFSNSRVLLKDMRQKKIQQYLSKLPNSIKFLAIVDGEGADFSEVDICSFPSLQYVHLKDTPNNFEENVKCEYNKIMDDLYEIKREDIGGGFMDLVINNMNQG